MKTLTIDIGTTTIKCALVSEGKIVEYFGEEYSLLNDGKNVTQNPQDWCDLIAKGIRSFKDLKDIKGVCISSQGITIVPVDNEGNPLCDAISWLDTSAEKELLEFQKKYTKDEVYNLTGKLISPYYSLSKIKKVVDSGLKVHKFLMPSDYIYFLMTGEYYTDYTMASGTMLYDINNRSYNKELLDFCGISENQLATPVEMGEKIGEVNKRGEEIFGIPFGTPVIMGAQDQKISAYACELKANVATVSIGTSTAISTLKKSKEYMPTFAYNKNDLIYEYALNTTGAAIKWLKNIAFDSYEEMDNCARNTKGCNGIKFSSDFTDGALIDNLSLSVTKGHIVNALYEDIAKRIKEFLPKDVTKLVIFGGGARNKYLCETIKNITNCEIEVPESLEIALMGADLLINDYYRRGK